LKSSVVGIFVWAAASLVYPRLGRAEAPTPTAEAPPPAVEAPKIAAEPARQPTKRVYDETPPDNAITLEPLAVVFARAFALEYERHVAYGWSVFAQPSVVFGASRLTATTDEEVGRGFSGYGVGLTLGARFFPFDRGLEGFFASAFVSVAWATATTNDNVNLQSVGVGVGLMAGYTFILGGVFDLSLGAGASYFEVHFDSGQGVERGVQPAIRAAMGAAF